MAKKNRSLEQASSDMMHKDINVKPLLDACKKFASIVLPTVDEQLRKEEQRLVDMEKRLKIRKLQFQIEEKQKKLEEESKNGL